MTYHHVWKEVLDDGVGRKVVFIEEYNVGSTPPPLLWGQHGSIGRSYEDDTADCNTTEITTGAVEKVNVSLLVDLIHSFRRRKIGGGLLGQLKSCESHVFGKDPQHTDACGSRHPADSQHGSGRPMQ